MGNAQSLTLATVVKHRLPSWDHIHLFVSVKPTDTPHLIAKAFKGRSSHHLRKEFPELKKLPTLWTSSYFVSTAGNVSSEVIKRYIEDPHHAKN